MKDENAVHALCQYYSKALMYEFSLNDRDEDFVNQVSNVRKILCYIFFHMGCPKRPNSGPKFEKYSANQDSSDRV